MQARGEKGIIRLAEETLIHYIVDERKIVSRTSPKTQLRLFLRRQWWQDQESSLRTSYVLSGSSGC